MLVIACGALAKEIQALKQANGWEQIKIQCIDAELHNRPLEIPDRLDQLLETMAPDYEHVFVGYADCGTGGYIDQVIAKHATPEKPIERLPGAHCYAFFAGLERFDEIAADEIGSFYLTDFLARHFDRLIMRGMGLEKHPELIPMMFGNYKRMVYLSQTHDPKLLAMAEAAAKRLDLEFVQHHTGYGLLADGLQQQVIAIQPDTRSAGSY